MDQNILFGYWNIRGLGQVARLLLAYTGLKWEDKQYSDEAEWFEKDKKSLGLDFPNLPYLIDGDIKITQSVAIYRYIIRNLNTKNCQGKIQKMKPYLKISSLQCLSQEDQQWVYFMINNGKVRKTQFYKNQRLNLIIYQNSLDKNNLPLDIQLQVISLLHSFPILSKKYSQKSTKLILISQKLEKELKTCQRQRNIMNHKLLSKDHLDLLRTFPSLFNDLDKNYQNKNNNLLIQN